jgi:hypothetical protein
VEEIAAKADEILLRGDRGRADGEDSSKKIKRKSKKFR